MYTDGTQIKSNIRARPHIVLALVPASNKEGKEENMYYSYQQQPITLSTGRKDYDNRFGDMSALVEPSGGYTSTNNKN